MISLGAEMSKTSITSSFFSSSMAALTALSTAAWRASSASVLVLRLKSFFSAFKVSKSFLSVVFWASFSFAMKGSTPASPTH